MQLISPFGRRGPTVCLSTGPIFLLAAAFAGAQNTAAGGAQPAPAQPVSITLEEAIHRAQANEPTYANALADSRIAALDRSIARAGLLPGVTYHNQYLYTQPLVNQAGQPASSQTTPRFIANNAVHEYSSQGVVDETIGVAQVADVRRANAAAALAAAELEISRRGLVATVSGLYYGV